MSLTRLRKNLGFLLAGAVLFGVAVNIYFEINTPVIKEAECQYTSTP